MLLSWDWCLGGVGRQRTTSKAANVQVLAAATLHRQPGLKTSPSGVAEVPSAMTPRAWIGCHVERKNDVRGDGEPGGLRVYIYICIYIYTYIIYVYCIYIYMYIYIHTWLEFSQ